MKRISGLKFCGFGRATGDLAVTNEDMEHFVDTSDEWIQSRTGIHSRYYAHSRSNAEMAVEAAEKAMREAAADKRQIVYLIVCSFTPDCATPPVACEVAGRLGLAENVMAIDLNGACSGFIYGCTVAESLLQANPIKSCASVCQTAAADGNIQKRLEGAKESYALVIGSEKISPLLDMEDRSTCILFGDGAGAVVVKYDENKRFQALCGCIPNQEILYCARFTPVIRMQGQEVYRFAVSKVPAAICDLLEFSEISADEVDYFVCHQAKLRIIDQIRIKLRQPEAKFFRNIYEFGNTSAASVAIALCQMNEEGLLREGMRLVCAGFGAGLTYGVMLLTL